MATGSGSLEMPNLISKDRRGPVDLTIRRAPKRNLVGVKFDRLTVMEYLGFSKTSQSAYWKCECSCGRVVAVRQHSMLRKGVNATKSCGCLAAEITSKTAWRGYGDLPRHYWNHLKHHAAERNVECLITIEEAWELFVSQGGRCAISGLELQFGRFHPSRRAERARGAWPRLGTASLDRKNSAGGYVSGNVQWVHKTINRMKGSLSDFEFIRICGLVWKANQHPSWRPEAGL